MPSASCLLTAQAICKCKVSKEKILDDVIANLSNHAEDQQQADHSAVVKLSIAKKQLQSTNLIIRRELAEQVRW